MCLSNIAAASELTDWPYIVGLMIFTVSVVGYTLIGGFLAAVWTDLFQSVMMWFGVVILLFLVAAGRRRRSSSKRPSRKTGRPSRR